MRGMIAGLATAAVLAAGCGGDDPSVTAEQRGRPVIVTALRPLAEVIERVAGGSVVVVDLVPVGESAHELDLTGRQEREILDAELAVVLGNGYQRDVERVAARRDGETLVVFDAMALPDRPDDADGPPDPHIWLDPTIMGSVATVIGEAVAGVVPDDAEGVRDRAAELVEQYVRLDAQLRDGLAECERSVIVTHHESFGWFAARYGFTTVGFDAAVPDDDPAPDKEHQERVEAILDDDDDGGGGGITTLFVESLSPPSWIEVIAEERGLDTAVLNPYEGLTTQEDASDITYRSVLLYDLRVLQDHLGCEP